MVSSPCFTNNTRRFWEYQVIKDEYYTYLKYQITLKFYSKKSFERDPLESFVLSFYVKISEKEKIKKDIT
jgi:hypothetical protein